MFSLVCLSIYLSGTPRCIKHRRCICALATMLRAVDRSVSETQTVFLKQTWNLHLHADIAPSKYLLCLVLIWVFVQKDGEFVVHLSFQVVLGIGSKQIWHKCEHALTLCFWHNSHCCHPLSSTFKRSSQTMIVSDVILLNVPRLLSWTPSRTPASFGSEAKPESEHRGCVSERSSTFSSPSPQPGRSPVNPLSPCTGQAYVGGQSSRPWRQDEHND